MQIYLQVLLAWILCGGEFFTIFSQKCQTWRIVVGTQRGRCRLPLVQRPRHRGLHCRTLPPGKRCSRLATTEQREAIAPLVLTPRGREMAVFSWRQKDESSLLPVGWALAVVRQPLRLYPGRSQEGRGSTSRGLPTRWHATKARSAATTHGPSRRSWAVAGCGRTGFAIECSWRHPARGMLPTLWRFWSHKLHAWMSSALSSMLGSAFRVCRMTSDCSCRARKAWWKGSLGVPQSAFPVRRSVWQQQQRTDMAPVSSLMQMNQLDWKSHTMQDGMLQDRHPMLSKAVLIHRRPGRRWSPTQWLRGRPRRTSEAGRLALWRWNRAMRRRHVCWARRDCGSVEGSWRVLRRPHSGCKFPRLKPGPSQAIPLNTDTVAPPMLASRSVECTPQQMSQAGSQVPDLPNWTPLEAEM